MNEKITKNRIYELDFFRGILILLVIFDHLMWFINFYCFKNGSSFINWYWTSSIRHVVRQLVLFAFMFACGISCYLSRNNLKRGILLLLVCIGIAIFTHLFQNLNLFNNRIISIDINILGVIALSILIFCLCSKLSSNNYVLIIVTLTVFYGFLLLSKYTNPDFVYNPFKSILFSPFNPIKEGYVADYLPLFPYIIFLFLGVLFARKYYKDKTTKFPKRRAIEKPICFLGRHTLIIYIVHEIVFTLLFMGINALLY